VGSVPFWYTLSLLGEYACVYVSNPSLHALIF
jgi:hypothetical protein